MARKTVSGASRMWSALLLAFVIDFSANPVHADGTEPVIHSICPQNETSVPSEYSGLPLVRKCCPLNEVLVKVRNSSMCVPSNEASGFSPLFSEYNRTGVMVPGDTQAEFVAIIGEPCRNNRYMLDPEDPEDEHYLLKNGSIFARRHAPRMLSPYTDYCMEIIPDMGLATLVCFPEDSIVSRADSRITFYAVGLLISVPFLILTIVAYLITPKLRDVHGKALCHYCGCQALAFVSLAIVQLGNEHLPDQVCMSIAFVIQFSFVACFFWLNVMCIETWSLVKKHVDGETYKRIKPKRLFFYYSLWGWGPPAVLILISMIMDLSPMIPTTYVKPTFGERSCWFKSDTEAMPYFYVPVGLLLLTNTVLFVITAVKITRYQQELALRFLARNQESDRLDQRLFRRLKRTFLVCVVLFFLMGLNWSMELISFWAGGDPLAWSAFDLVNALQGVLVFGLFVLRRPPRNFVWYEIQKLCGVNAVEPQVASMNETLLPMLNGDTLPRQTIIA